MTWAEFDAWSPRTRRGFAAQQVAAGLVGEREATALAEKVFADLLPEGLATPGHLFWCLQRPHEPTTAGYLWLVLRALADGTEAYVMDLEVLPAARRQGLGRATMLAAEQAARDLGASVMRLNVFAHNVAAVRLYEGLGYRASTLTLTLTLTARPHPLSRPGIRLSRPGIRLSRPGIRLSRPGIRLSRPGIPGPDGDGLWTAYDGQQPVARLRVELEHGSEGVHAFAHVVEGSAGPDPRHLETVLRTAHEAGADLGAARVSVAVAAPPASCDAGSGDLYERTGFRLTAQTLSKALWPPTTDRSQAECTPARPGP
jgi:ribosomal protein S18 acetylase RimI-like enzyme